MTYIKNFLKKLAQRRKNKSQKCYNCDIMITNNEGISRFEQLLVKNYVFKVILAIYPAKQIISLKIDY